MKDLLTEGPVDWGAGMLLCPCFSKFLARTTFVLESLPEAKNLSQDIILGDLCTLFVKFCDTFFVEF